MSKTGLTGMLTGKGLHILTISQMLDRRYPRESLKRQARGIWGL